MGDKNSLQTEQELSASPHWPRLSLIVSWGKAGINNKISCITYSRRVAYIHGQVNGAETLPTSPGVCVQSFPMNPPQGVVTERSLHGLVLPDSWSQGHGVQAS